MGMNVFAKRSRAAGEAASFDLTSRSNHLRPPSVDVTDTKRRDRWPEVHVTANDIAARWHGPVDGISVRECKVRLHGVTIQHLMDALIENPTTRRYLGTGVDHFRALEARSSCLH